MIFAFLPLFTFWWYLVFAGFFITLCIQAEGDESETYQLAATVLIWLVIVTLCGNTGQLLFLWMYTNPFYLISVIIGFFLTGFGYGIFRWWWDNSLAATKYEAANYNDKKYLLKKREYQYQKDAIIRRMTFWPFSLISFILKDFIYHLYEVLLGKFQFVFESISQRVWKNITIEEEVKSDSYKS